MESSLEKSISKMTNLLHSAGKNEINASDLVDINTDIECLENSLNFSKILETGRLS